MFKKKIRMGAEVGLLCLVIDIVFNLKELRYLEGADFWLKIGTCIFVALGSGISFGILFVPGFRLVSRFAGKFQGRQ